MPPSIRRMFARAWLRGRPLVAFRPCIARRSISWPFPRAYNRYTLALRHLSTIKTTATPADVFHEQGDAVLDTVADAMEDEFYNQRGVEVDPADGVVSVSIPSSGVWVLNKHSVTRQLWLSSPISGPNKFNFHQDVARWLGERDEHSLQDRLATEFAAAAGTPHGTEALEFEHRF